MVSLLIEDHFLKTKNLCLSLREYVIEQTKAEGPKDLSPEPTALTGP